RLERWCWTRSLHAPSAPDFFFSSSGDHRDLHSIPTRRSSDLPMRCQRACRRHQERHTDQRADATDQRAVEAQPLPDSLAIGAGGDRKSTRLNSSHLVISYAVFCLKKKIEPLRSVDVLLTGTVQ